MFGAVWTASSNLTPFCPRVMWKPSIFSSASLPWSCSCLLCPLPLEQPSLSLVGALHTPSSFFCYQLSTPRFCLSRICLPIQTREVFTYSSQTRLSRSAAGNVAQSAQVCAELLGICDTALWCLDNPVLTEFSSDFPMRSLPLKCGCVFCKAFQPWMFIFPPFV